MTERLKIKSLTATERRALRKHILELARAAEAEAYKERMAKLRSKKMALPPRAARKRVKTGA